MFCLADAGLNSALLPRHILRWNVLIRTTQNRRRRRCNLVCEKKNNNKEARLKVHGTQQQCLITLTTSKGYYAIKLTGLKF